MELADRRAKIRKEIREAFYAATALLVVIIAVAWWYQTPTATQPVGSTSQDKAIEAAHVPLASGSPEQYGRLGVEPHFTSPIPLYMIGKLRPIIMEHSGPFRLRCMYSDGQEMTVEGDNCPFSARFTLEYVINDGDKMIRIVYAYR